MKNIKRLVTFSIIIFINIVIFINIIKSNILYAESSGCEINIYYSGSSKMISGEEKELNIVAKEINFNNGIALYNGVLEYDQEKIEIKILNSEEWELYYQYNNNITLSRKNLENAKGEQEIGRIIVKAKKDIEIDDSIKLLKGHVTDGESVKDTNFTGITRVTDDSDQDTIAPIIESVTGNPTEWTKENVTLTVNARDEQSGLAQAAYSFDGGTTWQEGNTKTYEENTDGIVIKVKDKAGNIATYSETINITKIKKVVKIEVTALPNTEYEAYEDFDSTGMVVTITYNNEDQEPTTNYTIINGTHLTCQVESIEIQYNDDNRIKVEVPITVGHAKKDGEGRAATCTETGLTAGEICEVCNIVLVEQEEIPALGHSFTNYISDNNATCTEDGTETATCDRCDETDTRVVEGSKVPHNYEDGECTDCDAKEPKLEVSSQTYKIASEYVSRVEPNTTVEEFKQQFITNATEINVYSKSEEKQGETAVIATGMTIESKLGEDTKTFTIAVAGDANGDSKIDIHDLIAINNHRLKKKYLIKEYLIAGDLNENDKVDFFDLVRVNIYKLKRIKKFF